MLSIRDNNMRYLGRKLLRSLKGKSDFGEFIEDIKDIIWYNRISQFHNYKEQIERMWFWAWKMRKNYDFDAHTLYDIMYYKLDRIYNTMVNHSHLVWNSDINNKDMRRLSEARNLAKRLMECDYHTNTDKFYSMYKNPSKGTLDVLMNDMNPKAKILKDQKLYNYMFVKSYKKDEKLKQIHKKRLFFLLDRHIEGWWD